MNDKFSKIICPILLFLICALIILTIIRYFYQGVFDYTALIIALGCLVVYLITGKMKA